MPEEKKPEVEEKKPTEKESKKDTDKNEDEKSSKSSYKKGKKKKHVTKGQAHIMATYNNTIITFSDQNGNTLAWSSAGMLGFKGAKKATPFAAGEIVKNATEKVRDIGLKDLDIFVKGIGSGREAAVRALNASGFNILTINDKTPIPHNGCRAKKPRRV